MDQLTALRALGRAVPEPTDAALALGRSLLAAHIADAAPDARTDAPRGVAGRTPGPAPADLAPTAPDLRRTSSARPARRAFIALAAVAAAAVLAGVLITDQLSIGFGIGGATTPAQPGASNAPATTAAPSPTPSPGRTSFPGGFRLPSSCSEALGDNVLPVWSAAFGEATVIDESGYSVPGTDETGLHCVYGSNTGGAMLTIIVGTVDSAPGGRERADTQQESYGTTGAPFGDGTLFTFQPGLTPSPASMTFIDDTASLSVNVQGTDQSAGNLLPFLRATLDELGARTGAAVGPAGDAPLPDCDALGYTCGTAWMLNRS